MVQEDQESLSAEVLRGWQGRSSVVLLYPQGGHPGPSGSKPQGSPCPIFLHHSSPYAAAPPALPAVSVYAKSLLRLCYKIFTETSLSLYQMFHVNVGIKIP